jgi:magnesium transporter
VLGDEARLRGSIVAEFLAGDETPSVVEPLEPIELDTLPAVLERASSHATTSVPVAWPHEAAGALRERLIGRFYDTVADIPVCVDRRLVGMVRIEALLAADHEVAVSALMDPDPPCVSPQADQEIAAWTMLSHGEVALAVVDDDGVLLGLIPPQRMLRVLFQEHEEDISRFSGLLANSQQARMASEERVGRRLLHRMPWLAIGLIGAMVSAWLVGSAEEQLSRTVQLAFFLPAIVYMADAVGTQTETLAVRGISVGVPIRRFVGKEIAAGVLIGGLIAALFFPFSLWLFNDTSLAVAVSLSLLASCTVATAVALMLPWFLGWLHRDPAFGSGPLATVVQDLLSIAIYLALAATIVG